MGGKLWRLGGRVGVAAGEESGVDGARQGLRPPEGDGGGGMSFFSVLFRILFVSVSRDFWILDGVID
jgi:hypothetical protein